MKRWAAVVLMAALGCGPPATEEPVGAHPEPPPPDEAAPQLLQCRASSQVFARRTLGWLHGRGPLGAGEVVALGQIIDALEQPPDAAVGTGRRAAAFAMLGGSTWRRRWQAEIFELLRVRRDGHRVLLACHGETGPAAQSPALAQFVLEAPPTRAFAGGPWTMRDLVESSLRADDLRPILFADLLTRMTGPVDDANTSPDDLEAARRTNLARNFEAVYLGRRAECRSCHNDEYSVTDHPDPALDRSWPVVVGLDRLALPTDEEELGAVFRYEGFAGEGLAPWGAQGCGTIAEHREGDPFGDTAFLGGPLPPGAQAVDLQQRLARGLSALHERGWTTAPTDGEQALAQLVVLHWVDGLWASASGHRLTLDHGYPRSQAAAQRLDRLARVLVDSEYSLRSVLVEIAVDLSLDQASPAACEGEAPLGLPPLFDPFREANGPAHVVHRRDPLLLIDEAHRLFGRALPGQIIGQSGFDSAVVGALGTYLRDVAPGHDSVDLLGVLAWEVAVVEYAQAGADPAVTGEGPSVFEIIDAAEAESELTVGQLAEALRDRVVAEPIADDTERELVVELLGLPWERPVIQVDPGELRAAMLRYVRALLASPQFLLTGAFATPAETTAPSWQHPDASIRAACERWAPRMLGPEGPWACDDDGLQLDP